jgi:multidrug efflux pump subunit AcrA (membrane-fusion protein)
VKNRWIQRISFTLLWMVLGACGPQPAALPTETRLTVETNYAFDQGRRASGVVAPRVLVNLSFPASGAVTELLVQEGDIVRSGQVIARQDTSALEASIREAKTALLLAEADLDKALAGPHPALVREAQSRATAAAAVSPLTGVRATAQAASLAAAQAQLDYLASLPLPEDVAIARAQVEQAKARLEIAQARLERAVLTAPFDATILDVYIQAYEYALESEPVVQISDLSQLVIEAPMDDLDVNQLHPGDVVTATFEALPGLEAPAVVVRFQPNEKENEVKSFIAIFELQKLPADVRWGMKAEIRLPKK